MKTFDELWKYITEERPGVITVQDRTELEYVFNLMRDCDCESYLEVGTAEGNSLYVLGHALKQNGEAICIDLGEDHTFQAQLEIVTCLNNNKISTEIWKGDSTKPETFRYNKNRRLWEFDCILIDGGHDFATVLSDAILYASLATKYVFFHDVQLPQVKAAVDWFVPRWNLGKYHEFICSNSFGYGIIEVGK